MSGEISSQFLSGLLMAAPYARQAVELVPQGRFVSQPYIEMTLAVMADFGVEVRRLYDGGFAVPAGKRYRGRPYEIEPDASAASYFFAAAAITGGQVTVEGLSKNSIQGDIAFCDCLQKMGCKVEYREHAITVTGGKLQRHRDRHERHQRHRANARRPSRSSPKGRRPSPASPIFGTRKPTASAPWPPSCASSARRSRNSTTACGSRPRELHAARIDTYDDHRMAMSMALVGLRVPGVVILDPACTAKTYPLFFRDLEKVCKQATA